MTATEIYARLKDLAPNVAFSASKDEDRSCVWDGNGPDPADNGLIAYDVTVTACTILDGDYVEGNAYLGSCYMEHDEAIDDIGGYLPQKLEEAAEDLQNEIADLQDGVSLRHVENQLKNVIAFIKQEMQYRYDAQRQENRS